MNAAGMLRRAMCGLLLSVALVPLHLRAQQTAKPVLHGKHWMAVTGKPLAATAGAMIFQKGGNAVDAACAMIAADLHHVGHALAGAARRRRSSTTRTRGKVIGINALGVAPTGATPEFFHSEGMNVSARVRPARRRHARHAGRHDVMLAEYGTLSLKEVLGAGHRDGRRLPDRGAVCQHHRAQQGRAEKWPYSQGLPAAPGRGAEGPAAGRDLPPAGSRGDAAQARRGRAAGARSRARSARRRSMAAYDRFYKGDIAQELVRGAREQGGLITMEDLARLEGAASRSRSRRATRASTSTSSTSGRRARRCCRR